MRHAAAMTTKEEEIRIEVERQFAFLEIETGVKLEGKHEFTVAKGRIDSLETPYKGRFAIASALQEEALMGKRIVHVLAVAGVVLVSFGSLTPPDATSQENVASAKWEYKAVSFGSDETESTKKLNALTGEGWEYVGPLAHGLVAFRRAAGIVSPTTPPQPKAVYLMAGTGPQQPTFLRKEIEKHPEVSVVQTFQDLERIASQRTAIWIDAGAMGLFGDKEKEWVIRRSRKKYPFVLVGYNNALYSFREHLDCFLISGPGPIDWTQHQLTPGFSVIMQEERPTEFGGTEVSGFMRGYKQEPTFDAILAVTNRLLAGEPDPESP
jgi:hypothetical protein